MSGHEGKFLPSPDPGTLPYWEACKRHELVLQKCVQCEVLQFYPRTICSSCSSSELDWVAASGRGTVLTWTIVRHPVSPAYADEVPYIIALIELEEGPVMMAQVVDCQLDAVQSGMQVHVCFDDWTADITMPNFRPRDNNGT